jgi:hypothetical protein
VTKNTDRQLEWTNEFSIHKLTEKQLQNIGIVGSIGRVSYRQAIEFRRAIIEPISSPGKAHQAIRSGKIGMQRKKKISVRLSSLLTVNIKVRGRTSVKV